LKPDQETKTAALSEWHCKKKFERHLRSLYVREALQAIQNQRLEKYHKDQERGSGADNKYQEWQATK